MKIIDLFAGCGGMSLGFEFAGFDPILALEKDEWASATYLLNHPGVQVVTEDITKIRNFGDFLDNERMAIDGIIGGPPCQGFSLSGARDKKDPRNSLFMNYMIFVDYFKPKFFVMENVPGILSARTKNNSLVKNLIMEEGNANGYNVAIIQLMASDYGVPQSRERVFFIGLRKDIVFNSTSLSPKKISRKYVSIREALSDLPVIEAGEGWDNMPYPGPPQNNYQKWCRRKSSSIMNHIAMRHSNRIIERFKCIKFGQSLANAPLEHMQRKRGDAKNISGKIYSQNNMRPWPDLPAPTIPASFQSNFIHPLHNRNFTAREAARLQSFPDRYVFCGKRTTMSWEKSLSQYQQIGNAVPPLLAKAVAEGIHNYFNNLETIKPAPVLEPYQRSLL